MQHEAAGRWVLGEWLDMADCRASTGVIDLGGETTLQNGSIGRLLTFCWGLTRAARRPRSTSAKPLLPVRLPPLSA